jgi:hypothetical protein
MDGACVGKLGQKEFERIDFIKVLTKTVSQMSFNVLGN